jgi:hypothetical protein
MSRFFFSWPLVISTGRTRQDSEKRFFACETMEKIYGRKFTVKGRIFSIDLKGVEGGTFFACFDFEARL